MEYLIYLLRINLSLTLFWLVYKLFLSKLTFPSFNRAYFLGAILCSFVLPMLPKNVIEHSALLPHKRIVIPNFPSATHTVNENTHIFNWSSILMWMYILGAAVLLIRLLIQHYSIYRIYRNAKRVQMNPFKLVVTPDATPAFSFWKYIFIAQSDMDQPQMPFILAHEMQHVKRLHSVDILISQCVKIICWINPIAWLLAKDMQQNLEYEVDAQLIQTGINTKDYQYQLLHTLIPAHSLSITNHFNFYNLKKRIIMMNKEQSAKANLLRYAFVLPAILASVSYVQIAQADKINTHIKSTLSQLNAAPPMIVPQKQFNQSFMKPQPKSVKSQTNFKPKTIKNSKELFEKPVSFTVKIANSQNVDSVTKLNYDLQYKKDEMVLLVNGKTAGPTDKVEKSKIVSSNLLTEAEIAQSYPQFQGRQVLNVVTQ